MLYAVRRLALLWGHIVYFELARFNVLGDVGFIADCLTIISIISLSKIGHHQSQLNRMMVLEHMIFKFKLMKRL